MFWIELAPAFLFLFALFFIPESPRFLVAAGKNTKALSVLTSLMGESASAKLAEIQNTLAGSHHRPRLRDILDSKTGIRPIVWVGVGLAALQQLVGINVVFYYGAVLWQAAGFSEQDSLLINVVSGGVSIAACLVATFLVDRVGRKPLLLVGSVGMAVSLAVIAWVFVMAPQSASGTPDLSATQGYVAVVALCGFVAFFAATWGPIVWVLLSEMFPNSIRAAAMSITVMANWIANFIVSELFPELVGISLGLAYGLFTLFAVLSFFFVWKWVTETRGTELEEMDELEGIELDDDAAAPA